MKRKGCVWPEVRPFGPLRCAQRGLCWLPRLPLEERPFDTIPLLAGVMRNGGGEEHVGRSDPITTSARSISGIGNGMRGESCMVLFISRLLLP
jgi:hypothetical protein